MFINHSAYCGQAHTQVDQEVPTDDDYFDTFNAMTDIAIDEEVPWMKAADIVEQDDVPKKTTNAITPNF